MKCLKVGLIAAACLASACAAPAARNPSAAPTDGYVIFFDREAGFVSTENRETIEAIAADYLEQATRSGNFPPVEVAGHTDTAGSDRHNQSVSERRARAVAAVLVDAGVPADKITAVGKGESEPLVPTDDGVREPSNRRVVIRF